MKALLVTSVCLVLASLACTSPAEQQETEPTTQAIEKDNSDSQYDSALAQQYGADDYGMKQFIIAYLKEGPNRDQDSTEAVEIQQAHMENINKMAESGQLVLAGPFVEPDYEVKGIYVFDVGSLEEAKALTASDPAVQAGRLIMELRPWYGSAALVGIAATHKKISKKDH